MYTRIKVKPSCGDDFTTGEGIKIKKSGSVIDKTPEVFKLLRTGDLIEIKIKTKAK